VLVFHESNGARLTVGSHDFEMLVNYLDRNRNRICTGTFAEIAGKIQDFQSHLLAAGPGAS